MRVTSINSDKPFLKTEANKKTNPTDVKITELKNKIVNLINEIEIFKKMVDDLKKQFEKKGITPLPSFNRGPVRVSREEGETGELETKVFALENQLSRLKAYLARLQIQGSNI